MRQGSLLAGIIGMGLVWLTAVGGAAYIIIHFIRKFW